MANLKSTKKQMTEASISVTMVTYSLNSS